MLEERIKRTGKHDGGEQAAQQQVKVEKKLIKEERNSNDKEINMESVKTALVGAEEEIKKENGSFGMDASMEQEYMDVMISRIANNDIITSKTAVQELYEVVRRRKKTKLLREKIDQLVSSATTQLRMLSERYLPQVTSGNQTTSPVNQHEFVSLCKGMFGLMIGVFQEYELAQNVSTYVLFDLFRAVLLFITNEKVAQVKDGDKLTQALNSLVKSMLSHCDITSMICAAVKVMHDSMDFTKLFNACVNLSPSFTCATFSFVMKSKTARNKSKST
jgi:hypothetical protein